MGYYEFKHDDAFFPNRAFHISLDWLFATTVDITNVFQFKLRTRVKDAGFNIIPISGIIHKEHLNAFEQYTELRTKRKDDEGDKAKLFYKLMRSCLRDTASFVEESRTQLYSNFIHSSGIGVVRIYKDNEVQWIENDQISIYDLKYKNSNVLLERVRGIILSVDTMITWLYSL